MRRRLRELGDESGQTLVVVAVSMIALLSFLGLAIDVGYLHHEQTKLQTLADQAALAAGLEIRVCALTANCSMMSDAAQSSMIENGYVGTNFLWNCATSGDALTLTLNDPPCALGVKDPNTGNNRFAEVVVSKRVPTFFMRILGFNTFKLSARAESSRDPKAPCIFAIDPSASGAISVTAGLGIRADCGVVDESSSPSAFSCLVGIGVSAPTFDLHGGAAGLLCPVTSRVRTGTPVRLKPDPLAYLPKPAVGACGSKVGSEYYGSASAVTILLAGNYVFNPGVYCGGISMAAALLANITFRPGLYVLKTGPGLLGVPSGGLNLTLSALSNITGNGVTFYNYGPVGGISVTAAATLGLSNFSLTAPTSGLYGGVLFMQDPGNTTSGVFVANLATGSKLEGAIYLPNALLTYGVGAVSSAYTIVVAKTLQFNVAVLSRFGNDYSSLALGSPLDGDDTILVQ